MNNVTILFSEIFLILWSFDGTTHDVINLLICITQELKYLWKERRYFKMENAILHDFEMTFKWALFIFYFIGNLSSAKMPWSNLHFKYMKKSCIITIQQTISWEFFTSKKRKKIMLLSKELFLKRVQGSSKKRNYSIN